MVCSQKPTFQQCSNLMHKFQILGWYDNMSKVILCKSIIPIPVIRTDCAVLLNNPFNKRHQAGPGSILQMPQTNTPNAFFFVFYCNANKRFAFSATTAFSWLFSAHIGFIDFDQTTQLISAGPLPSHDEVFATTAKQYDSCPDQERVAVREHLPRISGQ